MYLFPFCAKVIPLPRNNATSIFDTDSVEVVTVELTTRKLFVIFVVVIPEAVTVDPVKVDNDNALVVTPEAVTVDPVKVDNDNALVVTPEAVTVDPVKVDNDNALVVTPEAVTVDPNNVETPNNPVVNVDAVTVEFIVRRLRVVECPDIVLPIKDDI
jgi:hypothetical protein